MSSTNPDGSITTRTVPGWLAMVEHSAKQAGMTAEQYWSRIQERDREVQEGGKP